MGVGLKSGIWKTHRRHAEEERIRAKDMALKTVTFQGLKRKSIEETKKEYRERVGKTGGLCWESQEGREFPEVKEHGQLSYHFRFSPSNSASGYHFKSQSQL